MPTGFPPHLRHLLAPDEPGDDDAPEPGPRDALRAATWRYAWPAGERMAAELGALASCAGRAIADLGCGRGHLGLTALVLGARRALFADGNRGAVGLVEQTVARNGFCDRARAVVHTWGDAIPEPPYALILGGDILYRPECFPALAATVAASLAPDGTALVSDPRPVLEPEFAAACAERGLRSASERRRDYTLVRLTRA